MVRFILLLQFSAISLLAGQLGLNQTEWEKDAIGQHCLTIEQVNNMRPGQNLMLLVLSYNHDEIAAAANPKDTVMIPHQFYRLNGALYTQGSKGGTIGWMFDGVGTVSESRSFTFKAHWSNTNYAGKTCATENDGGAYVPWEALLELPDVYWSDIDW